MGHPDAVIPLIRILSDIIGKNAYNAYCREYAIQGLGDIGDPRAIAALKLTYSNDPDFDCRKMAAESLKKIGDPVVLEYQLQSPNWEDLNDAAVKFGILAGKYPEAVIPVLDRMVKNLFLNGRISTGSALALTKICEGNPNILNPYINVLIEFLNYTKTTTNYEIVTKRGIVYILGIIAMNKPNVIAPIIYGYVNDEDELVRKNAKEGFLKIKTLIPNIDMELE
jgi:HEAT repeat protein